jgi:transcriptional regulator with XRE-family HTH domain
MREAQGDTMESFAARLRVALNTVSRWENSAPPTRKSLERLYRFAKRHGPATSADALFQAIMREKSAEHRRYRTAQILVAGNLQNAQIVLRRLYQYVKPRKPFEIVSSAYLPSHERLKQDLLPDLLQLADLLFPEGRKEMTGENE